MSTSPQGPSQSSYDLGEVVMPPLTGGKLKVVAFVSRVPGLSKLFAGFLRKSAGISAARKEVIDTKPSNEPAWPKSSGTGAPLAPNALTELPEKAPAPVARPRVRDYVEAYKSGALSPVTVAERLVKAMRDEGARELNAFVLSHEREIIAQARASEARWKAGKPLSLLDGVPVAVKDEIDQAGYGTMGGTNFLGKEPAQEDATVVARLRKAGAMLIGKTTMHEIGIAPNGENANHGQVRNPYDPGCDTGGSSSGSAAAVSAGLCPIAIGADGGGSIRVPAAFTGVVGLKPTWGRVSEHGALPLCRSVGHIGPITACVEDAAIGYAVIAGPDEKDAATALQPPVSLDGLAERDVKGLRIGIDRAWFAHADPEIVAACQAAVERLVLRGAVVVDVSIKHLESMRVAQVLTIFREMANAMEATGIEDRRFTASTDLSLALGHSVTPDDYAWAARARTRAMQELSAAFDKVDVLITPSTAITANKLPPNADAGWSDNTAAIRATRFAFMQNLTGLPALSVPAGYDKNGLPVGVEITAPAWHEARALQVGQVIEAGVRQKRPKIFYDLLA